MDISSLTALLGNQPSLIDYLTGNASSSSGTAGGDSSGLDLLEGDTDSTDSSSDSISLSPMAQILAAQNGTSTATSSGASSSSSTSSASSNGVQAAASNFLTSFFSQSGVNTSNLSPDAQQLLQGFQSMITNSGATSRDTKTDTLENQYQNGNRQVYTLTGNNQRIRIAIDYTNGTPSDLKITDINGGTVDTATVTLTKDSSGTLSGINIDRGQSTYTNGILASSTTPASISLDLYGSNNSGTASSSSS
jgi:hypothetical protein